MRRFLNVKIKKESFDSLSHHFLQKKLGNILGTYTWEHRGNVFK